jgi:excisionase family DNA binding protein
MIIVQLDSEQLSDLIQSAVRKVIAETPQSEHPETDQLFTIKEAAVFLHLSVPTIYGLVNRSEIPVSKKGKRLYFSKQELTEWIKSGRKKTIAEINSEADTYLKSKKK